MHPAHITATGLDGPNDSEELVDGLAERLLCLLVTIGMEVLDSKPLVPLVDVADHLLMSQLRLELHSFVAMHAVDLAARFDQSGHRTADLFDLDGLGRCCSLCHTDLSADCGPH
ncbi:MAG: hypothetical protein ACI81L_000150 [Verrucomicrobiales bacterium]